MAQLTGQDKKKLSQATVGAGKQADPFHSTTWQIGEGLMKEHAQNTPDVSPLPSSVSTEGYQWDCVAEALLADYLQSHQEAVTAIKAQVTDPLQRVEALSKLSTAMDRTFRALDRGTTTPELPPLVVARTVLARQSEFIKQRFPRHLPAFLEILEPFGQELLADASWQTGTTRS